MSLNVVAIGGGLGLSQVSRGLKEAGQDVRVTAIVGTHDDGGSTHVLRREWPKMLGGAISDLSRNIAALCPRPDIAEMVSYRFEGGETKFLSRDRHSIKNLLYAGAKLHNKGDLTKTLEQLWWFFQIAPHRVIPISDQPTHLEALLRGGMRIRYESLIDTLGQNPLYHSDIHEIVDVFLEPVVPVWSVAHDAIVSADKIVIAPGTLWTSSLAVLSADGIKDAFRKSQAQLILVMNLLTWKGDTGGYTGEEYLEKIQDRIGLKINKVFLNSAKVPDRIRKRYKREKKLLLPSFFPSSSLDPSHPWHDSHPYLVEAPFGIVTKQGEYIHDHRVLANEFRRLFRNGGKRPRFISGAGAA